MKFLLISPKNRTVYNFRGDLIKEFISRGYEVIVTGPDKTDVDKIEALGASFVEIPMNKTGTSVFGDIKYCKKLYSLMKKEKPDITLGYTVKPVVYGAIAAKLAGPAEELGILPDLLVQLLQSLLPGILIIRRIQIRNRTGRKIGRKITAASAVKQDQALGIGTEDRFSCNQAMRHDIRIQ